jgi:hypothetical protein
MRATRRRVLTIAGAAILGALPLHRGRSQAQRPPARTAPRITVSDAQIYLIRGLFGVFSTGMDQLAAQFKAQGYSQVSLWGWTDTEAIAGDIIAGNQRGDTSHVVLIGHSLGSNAVVQVAELLRRQNIPVDLAVTFDITQDVMVPPNVARFVNYYQNNGFGRPAIAPPGYRGDLRNVNLTDQSQIDHVTIDKAPQLQAFVRDQVYQITHTHIRTVTAKRKAKSG